MTMTMIAAASSQKRSGRPFIIKVNHTAGFTVTLPLYNAGGYNYNFIVDWGDGAVSQVISATDANRIHTYTSGGTYTIIMTGTLEGWTGNATGMKEYIIEVTQWGRTGFKGVGVAMHSCTRLAHCYGKLTTSQTDVRGLLQGCSGLISCETSDWDVSGFLIWGANWAGGAFYGCINLLTLDVSNWVFSTTSDIQFHSVFYNCRSLNGLDTSGWNTERFTHLTGVFRDCRSLTALDVSGWDVSKVVEFGHELGGASNGCFFNCIGLTSLDCSGWRFSSVSNVTLSALFHNCTNLTTIGDTSGWTMGKVTNMSGTFTNCYKLASLNVTNWDVSGCSTWSGNNLGGTFQNCVSLTSLDVSLWNTVSSLNMDNLFNSCTGLTSLDVSGWNVSNVTRMISTFYNCNKLTTLDVSAWNVSKITYFGYIWGAGTFENCSSLTALDLSGWRFSTTVAVSAGRICSGCTSLTTVGDLSGWTTSKVTYFNALFNNCYSLTSLNCSNWDLSSCTELANVFSSCRALTTLNVSGWTLNTTTNVTMNGMFYNCQALTSLSFTGWNTSKVTNFQQFLDQCFVLATCDVSVLSTAAATNVSYMFRDCRALTSVNISGWDLSKVVAANMTQYMFYGCYGLTSLTLPASLSRVDNQFAAFNGTPACTRYDIYRATAPTVSGTPFSNYAKPLHVPVSNSGYDVSPWTNTAIFSSIINDL